MRKNIIVLLAVLFAGGSCWAVELSNGDFELGFQDWRYYAVGGAAATYTLSNDAYSGSNAALIEVTNPTGDTSLDRWDTPVPVEYLQNIKVSFAAKRVSGNTLNRVHLIIAAFDASGNFIDHSVGPQFDVTDSYAMYSTYYAVKSPDIASLTIAFRIINGATQQFTTGSMLIDNVSMVEAGRIGNGGFEYGYEGWRGYAVGGAAATYTISSDAYQGYQAADMNVTVGPLDHALDREFAKIAVAPGEKVGFRFAVKNIGTAGTGLRVTISEFNSGTYLGNHSLHDFIPGSDYAEYFFVHGVQNASTNELNIGFTSYTGDFLSKGPGHYLLDAVEVVDLPMILNGDFEFSGNLDYWRGYAVGTGAEAYFTISNDAFTGSQAASMEVINPGDDHAMDIYENMIPTAPGETVAIGFAAKNVLGDNTKLRLSVAEYRDTGPFDFSGRQTWIDLPVGSSYEEFEFTHNVVDPNADKLDVVFTIVDDSGVNKSAGHYLIDNVRVVNAQLVGNGGFESDFDAWRSYAVGGGEGTFTIISDAYEGSKAALMDITVGGGDHGLDRWESKIPVDSDDELMVSFAGKKFSGVNTYLQMTISEWKADGTYLEKYGVVMADPGTAEYGIFGLPYAIQSSETEVVNIGFAVVNGDGIRVAGSYLIDSVQMRKGNDAPEGDIDYDFRVDGDDLAWLSSNWLGDGRVGDISSDVPINDFEGYADQAALETEWQEFYWAGSQGSSTSSTVTLLTNPADAYEGNQALRWTYDAEDLFGNLDFTDIILTFTTGQDMRGVDAVKLMINRHAGNSEELLLYMKFLNGGVDVSAIKAESYIYRVDGSTYSPTGWSEWVVDMNNFNVGDKSMLDDVQAVVIGCWSPATDPHGSGVIDIDSIRVDTGKYCDKDVLADMDDDCKVTLSDYAILARNWLTIADTF